MFAVLMGCVPSAVVTSTQDVTIPQVESVPSPVVVDIPPPVVVELVPAPRRILIVGDSEACAVSPYVKLVKDPLDTVDVDCKGGTTVPYWSLLGNFRAALSRHPKPDSVLIFLGTNHYSDPKANVPGVKNILGLVQERNINCVWVGNTAVHGKHWPINVTLKNAVTPTCDYFDTEQAGIQLSDGVHPTREGAIKWLKAIWPTIPQKYEEKHDN